MTCTPASEYAECRARARPGQRARTDFSLVVTLPAHQPAPLKDFDIQQHVFGVRRLGGLVGGVGTERRLRPRGPASKMARASSIILRAARAANSGRLRQGVAQLIQHFLGAADC